MPIRSMFRFDLLRFRHQQALQFFRLIDNFFADQPHLAVHYIVENPGLPCMFSPIHLRSQGLRGIVRLNGNRQSENYRAPVIDRITKCMVTALWVISPRR